MPLGESFKSRLAVDPGGYEGSAGEDPYASLRRQVQEAVLDPTSYLQTLSAGLPLAAGRIGVMPGRERLASEIIKRGLKEPWFHGTAAGEPPMAARLLRLIEQGFDPKQTGSTMGLRLGEPAGVSLSRDPRIAAKFGTPLRVAVDVPPSSVGQFVDPEFQRLLRTSFETALSQRKAGYNQTDTMLDWIKSDPGALPYIQERLRGEYPAFNRAMSDYLRQQGVEAIAYNPKRWKEFELRVLDPKKAVPLGVMPTISPWSRTEGAFRPERILERYVEGSPNPYKGSAMPASPNELRRGLSHRLWKAMKEAPDFPVRLRDVLNFTGVSE